MRPKGEKSVENRRRYQKTDKKSEKSIFAQNSTLFTRVQAFILSQNDMAGLLFPSKVVI